MSEIAERYKKRLKPIKEKVHSAYTYFQPNYDRFNEFREFVFKQTLSSDDIALYKQRKMPNLEFNILNAYIARLRGEFSKQEPSICVRALDGAKIDPEMIELIEGHLRAILFDANKDSLEYDVYTDLLSGGFSVARVYTEYMHEMSFDQKICIKRSFDPTLTGFDPLAQLSHKGDGAYCFELYPKSEDDFKEEFPDVDISEVKFTRDLDSFNWSYRESNNNKVLLICDFYEKKKKRVRIVQLVTGKVMPMDEYKKLVEEWNDAGMIQQPPAIRGEPRWTEIETICRYRLIENQILEYIETDYKCLPLVFVDGDSVVLRNNKNSTVEQMTRPYVYHAKGVQKLKNFAGITLANALENMVQHKWVVAKESIPQEAAYQEAYINPQQASTLVYEAFKDTNPDQPLPPPREVQIVPAPPEVAGTFAMADQMTQTILGSYDAALGINDNQLSGVAIVEGATQSNATAMPYVVGFLNGLTRAAQIIIDLIPKYYKTPRTIPVLTKDGERKYVAINEEGKPSFDYDPNVLEIRVEAGVNFGIQKSRALAQVTSMMQASQIFSQFINSDCLDVLVDNMEFRGSDMLKERAQEFMEKMKQQEQMAMQQAQQQAQNNPETIRAQVEMQKLQHQNERLQVEAKIKEVELENERMKLLLETANSRNDNLVQIEKTKTERIAKAMELEMSHHDMRHRHAKEFIETHHKVTTEKPHHGTT